MKKSILLLVLLSVGCKKAQPHAVMAATNAGPATAVNITDQAAAGGNILGADGVHPLFTVVVDGGSGGSSSSGVITNDAGNPVPVDQLPGDLQNTAVIQNAIATSGVLIDAGTHYLAELTITNEDIVTGFFQVYCGQTITDAGGTSGAATVPSWQVRCPPGNICALSPKAPIQCVGGATWYSSVDAGFLKTTSAPGFTVTEAVIR